MANVIELPDLRNGYVDLANRVMAAGRTVNPRGEVTRELEDVTVVIRDLADVLPVGVGRKLNLDVACMEALQLIGGRATPQLLEVASPHFKKFAEFDGHYHGAYGQRVGTQLDHVINKIKHDPSTRQAVITLWDPVKDNLRGYKDYPCTIALGFRLRGDKVNLSVVMRSNDLFLGLAYDAFQFTQALWTVANVLSVEPGTYSHTAWSLHIYERNFLDVEAMEQTTKGRDFHPLGLLWPADASTILDGRLPRTKTASHEWYHARVMKLMERLNGPSELG